MIPAQPTPLAVFLGIPRESGDDPLTPLDQARRRTYSPRERG